MDQLESIITILQRRDGLSLAEAQIVFEQAKLDVADGEDPEEVLQDLGLEPDYILQLLED